jgi:hypothetical protein
VRRSVAANGPAPGLRSGIIHLGLCFWGSTNQRLSETLYARPQWEGINMRKKSQFIRICALLLAFLTLSAMAGCPNSSTNTGQGSGGNASGGSSGGMGGGGY